MPSSDSPFVTANADLIAALNGTQVTDPATGLPVEGYGIVQLPAQSQQPINLWGNDGATTLPGVSNAILGAGTSTVASGPNGGLVIDPLVGTNVAGGAAIGGATAGGLGTLIGGGFGLLAQVNSMPAAGNTAIAGLNPSAEEVGLSGITSTANQSPIVNSSVTVNGNQAAAATPTYAGDTSPAAITLAESSSPCGQNHTVAAASPVIPEAATQTATAQGVSSQVATGDSGRNPLKDLINLESNIVHNITGAGPKVDVGVSAGQINAITGFATDHSTVGANPNTPETNPILGAVRGGNKIVQNIATQHHPVLDIQNQTVNGAAVNDLGSAGKSFLGFLDGAKGMMSKLLEGLQNPAKMQETLASIREGFQGLMADRGMSHHRQGHDIHPSNLGNLHPDATAIAMGGIAQGRGGQGGRTI